MTIVWAFANDSSRQWPMPEALAKALMLYRFSPLKGWDYWYARQPRPWRSRAYHH